MEALGHTVLAGIDFPAAPEIRDAIAARIHDPAVLDEDECGARRPARLELRLDERIHGGRHRRGEIRLRGRGEDERDVGEPGEIHPSIKRT